ncbi:alpha/beta hydrolase, partial [Klebsiella pneumoniae]|uniref:alpha/beta hydrolase n=1 Tax=Klebsiella pneumoniae TaxID=573 RepID=UPI0013D14E83
IYAPASSGMRRPVILFIYGGAWNTGGKADYAFAGRAFAARGFVTAIADYRLVPEVRFPDFIDDGARALALIRDQIGRYGGDRNRIHL